MLQHREIPLHSRILVRIFVNAVSKQGKLTKGGLRGTPAVYDYMAQFSQVHPLFDFIDCGGGKERADSKIGQNFEFFVSNPYCSRVFLAVCYDNGFVRMLEPYQSMSPVLQNKIVLVKAGQTALEFDKLPFELVDFPSVFKERYALKLDPHRSYRVPQCRRAGDDPSEETEEGQHMVHVDRVNLPSTSRVVGLMRGSLLFRDAGIHCIPIISDRRSPTAGIRCASVTPILPFTAPTTCCNHAAGGLEDSKWATRTRPVPNIHTTKRIKEIEAVIHAKEVAATNKDLSPKVRKRLRKVAGDLRHQVRDLQQEMRKATSEEQQFSPRDYWVRSTASLPDADLD